MVQGVKSVLRVLEKVEELAQNTPPVDNSGSRFGNPAFRTFYDRIQEVTLYYRLLTIWLNDVS